jgi:dolichyl-phosphate-mannose-protein mannosyltransferase
MGRSAKSSSPKTSDRSSPAAPSKKHDDYTSEGVEDRDVFLLPGSDYRVMIGVTIVAAIVRLFRIYQPSSVVFDEVQYA